MARRITGSIFLAASALLSTLFLAQVAQTSTWELGKPEQFESGIKATAAVSADLDKDGQVSLLEAYLAASRQTAEFYKTESRLATEHALLDDNGDGLGTPAEWFRGLRATKRAKDNTPLDGLLASQFYLIASEAERNFSPEELATRDRLERAVLIHREKKDHLSEDEYYRTLEALLLDLARFYAARSSRVPGNGGSE